MPESRIVSGKPPFYVGFSNCLSNIIYELRKLYPRRPHFLPADAEIPHTDYIFLGYNAGAVMHVSRNYISTVTLLPKWIFIQYCLNN